MDGNERPHRYAAKTPEGRRRQLANMQQRGKPSNALVHGVESEHKLARLRRQARMGAGALAVAG